MHINKISSKVKMTYELRQENPFYSSGNLKQETIAYDLAFCLAWIFPRRLSKYVFKAVLLLTSNTCYATHVT